MKEKAIIILLLVDNANPLSMESAINNINDYKVKGNEQKLVLLGDMLELGDIDKDHHRSLGKYLSDKNIDAVFAYGNLIRHTIKAIGT